MKILTVCLGNICRSPAAESVLIHELSKAGIDADVRSAGTSDYHIGQDAHHLTRKVGTERGYEFSSVAAQITAQHIDEVDLVLAMDDSNLKNILALTKNGDQRAKIVRFGALLPRSNQTALPTFPTRMAIQRMLSSPCMTKLKTPRVVSSKLPGTVWQPFCNATAANEPNR